MLAYSAKIYVEQQADRRARLKQQEERKAKRIAKFCADQVGLFWQNAWNEHTEKIPNFESTIGNVFNFPEFFHFESRNFVKNEVLKL